LAGSNKLWAHYIRLLDVVFKSALNRIPPLLFSARREQKGALNNTLDGRGNRKKGIILTDFDCVTEWNSAAFAPAGGRNSCALVYRVPLLLSDEKLY